MLSKDDLNHYIANVPAIPSTLKECSLALEEGDLIKAAHIAAKDRALILHFQNIVNKPIFGFRNELTDATQIFGALGINRVKQILKSYYTLLLTPKKWDVFAMNTRIFQELQASFIVKWEKILSTLEEGDEEILELVTLIPAAVAVCESIFKKDLETIKLIKAQRAISYEEILIKMSGYNFFDIVVTIAKKWEFSEKLISLIKLLSKPHNLQNNTSSQMIQYLILLINYEISRPIFIESGINDLFQVNTDFSEEIIMDFYKIMEELEV